MNVLSYRSTDDNGLSFVLLVDGIPLGELVGARDCSIPHWSISAEAPYLAPLDAEPAPDLRMVCCCSCGMSDCGHTACRVLDCGECVVFQEFDADVSPSGRDRVFCFSQENYEQVMMEILREAKAFHTPTG